MSQIAHRFLCKRTQRASSRRSLRWGKGQNYLILAAMPVAGAGITARDRIELKEGSGNESVGASGTDTWLGEVAWDV